uniref:Intracisternal A particle-promoted polypeptide n=1 Tax=Leptobrachium leishanense TaxID=445787 RepID=A0A8C5QBP8_9ANUR
MMDVESPTKDPGFQHSADRHAQSILSQINRMRLQLEFCDLQLQGLEPSSFQLLLDFIYTGLVTINAENVQALMTAADMLQLNHMVDLCCNFLKNQIEPGNCIGFFQFSEQLACQPLVEFTEAYIHARFSEVQVGDEFPTLTKDQLVRILRSEELCIENEYQIFSAAMTWLQRDIASRKKHVVEVMEPVRFALLPPQRLQKSIEDVPDFNLRVALQTLLREYCEPCLSPKDKQLLGSRQASRGRPRRKARKFLYAIGGYTRLFGGRWSDSRALSCVERYDTFSQYWCTVSSLHRARSGMSVAVLEGKIYVLGGEKDSMIFDCVECYDPVHKQWTSVSCLNVPRCGLGACACHGTIYALGGWVGAEIGDSIERFSPEENTWQVVGRMSVPRYNFACCEREGLIYVVGGVSRDGNELTTAEVYDPIANRWTSLPPMRYCRAYLGLAVLDDHMYAVGGWNETQDALSLVERFSFEEEQWVEVAPMRNRRAGVSVINVSGMLYAVGGRASVQNFSAPVTFDSVEIYDPHSDSWTEISAQ